MNRMKKIYCRTFQSAFKFALPFLPYRKPKIAGSVKALPDILKKHKCTRVLIITDTGIQKLGLTKRLEQALENNGVLYTGDIGYLEDGLLYIEGRKNREVKINGRRIRLEHLEENWKKYFRSNMVCSFDDSKLYLLVEGKISEENVKKLREWIPILEKDIIAREVDKLPRKANGKVNVAFRA